MAPSCCWSRYPQAASREQDRAAPPTDDRGAAHKDLEAASESLATAIDGGYQVEQLESWRWDGNPGQ